MFREEGFKPLNPRILLHPIHTSGTQAMLRLQIQIFGDNSCIYCIRVNLQTITIDMSLRETRDRRASIAKQHATRAVAVE